MSKTSELLIMFAAMCWGSTGTITRPLSAAGFSFVEMTATRTVFAAVCLFSFLLITDRKALKFRLKDVWLFFCMGLFGSVLMGILYFYTIETITMAAASVLLYTAPYMAIIMSAFVFKEKITLQKMSALVIAFIGCIMTVGVIDSGHLSMIGIMAGLAAAFFYSTQTIIGKVALMRGYGPLTLSAYYYAVAGIILLPFCDYAKMAVLIGEDSNNLKYLFILGFFISVLPSSCYFQGLKRTEAGRALIIAYVEPLSAAILGFVVFEEALTPIRIFGMALILVSLIILNLKRAEKL
jgi:drug/metabolite transporter (DMT)-like permease